MSQAGQDARGGSGPRGRLWRYGPVALWVGVIFFASTGTMAASNTSRVVRPLLLWLIPDITEESLLLAHMTVRKGAHLAEYSVLALLAARAFLTSSKIFLRARWLLSSLALAAAVALLDEYHQSFLPSRAGTIYDSMIDIAGAATALLLLAFRRRPRRAKV